MLKNLTTKLWFKLLFCFILITISDFLFYKQKVGWTAGLFTFLMASTIVLFNINIINQLKSKLFFLLLIGLSVALITDTNPSANNLVVVGLITFILHKPAFKLQNDFFNWISKVWRFCALIPVSLPRDFLKTTDIIIKKNSSFNLKQFLLLLCFPLILSVLFISLFASANPIIMSWINKLFDWNLDFFIEFIKGIQHIFYWFCISIVLWAFLRPKLLVQKQNIYYIKPNTQQSENNTFFNTLSLIYSLIIFNLIFLGQTILDLIYLWGGKTLPSSFTYAEYAHRGAYSLIATALIAGLFVIIVLKPKTERAENKIVKSLVYFWILQNIMLVISSIWRTSLYIETFMLTRLRIAALIWMFLVAIGLILLLIRIFKQKNNNWLINANIISLFSVLYFCSFINFNSFIANYNVKHCREFKGKGYYLDIYYLYNLGVDSLPALIKYQEKDPYSHYATEISCSPGLRPLDAEQYTTLSNTDISFLQSQPQGDLSYCTNKAVPSMIMSLTNQAKKQLSDWRGWTIDRNNLRSIITK